MLRGSHGPAPVPLVTGDRVFPSVQTASQCATAGNRHRGRAPPAYPPSALSDALFVCPGSLWGRRGGSRPRRPRPRCCTVAGYWETYYTARMGRLWVASDAASAHMTRTRVWPGLHNSVHAHAADAISKFPHARLRLSRRARRA